MQWILPYNLEKVIINYSVLNMSYALTSYVGMYILCTQIKYGMIAHHPAR